MSIQHVPLTEAELLIFAELLFTSPDKSHCGGLSFAPAATQSLPRVCSSVRDIVYLPILPEPAIKVPLSVKSYMYRNGLSCSPVRVCGEGCNGYLTLLVKIFSKFLQGL